MNAQHLQSLFLAGALGILSMTSAVSAADCTKANNTNDLNVVTSWSGWNLPGSLDVAIWNNSVSGANTVALGADLNWMGISILNPGGQVTIGTGNTLTLGGSGIAMNSATADLTINANLVLGPGQQVWSVASGRVLTLTGAFSSAPGAVNFTLPSGTQSATNGIVINTTNSNGILGAWARTGNDWATNSTNSAGGNIVAYTGYADVTRLSSGTKTVTSNAASNIRIVEGMGTVGNIYQSSAVTDINSLLNSATGGSPVYWFTNQTLRLGSAGGIMSTGNQGLSISDNTNDGTLTAGGAANTAGTIYLTNLSSQNLNINSKIADNGAGAVSVVISGSSNTVFRGDNTYTGKTTVHGSLVISKETSLGTPPSSFTADQLTFAGGSIYTTTEFAIDDSNRGITLAPGGATFTPDYSTRTLTLAVPITGPGTLTKYGTGILSLTSANTYTGMTSMLGTLGTLAIANVNALQNSTLNTGDNAGEQSVTFTVIGTNTYNIGGLQGTDPLEIGANTISIGSNNETRNFSGPITGTGGSLIKVGTGTQSLSGANTFSGTTTINSGTLALNNVNALQNSTLDTGSTGTQQLTFTITGANTYNLGGLQGSAGLILGENSISVGANGSSTTFGGNISGIGNLTKVGNGTLTLAGAKTYTGNTTVSAGTLSINSPYLAASSAVSIASGAVLNLNFSGTNVVTSLTLGTTTYTSGTIDSTNSGGYITGTGALRLGGNTYTAWAAAHNIPSATALVDSDNDDLPDAWEMFYFGNLSQDGNGDYDSDSVRNSIEFASLLNPTSAQTVSGTPDWQGVPGTLRYERWNDVEGTSLADFYASSAFQADPGVVDLVTSAEIPQTQDTNFGARIRGTLIAPTSGQYQFFISSDNQGEFYLGTELFGMPIAVGVRDAIFMVGPVTNQVGAEA